jgi:hypothetical protein
MQAPNPKCDIWRCRGKHLEVPAYGVQDLTAEATSICSRFDKIFPVRVMDITPRCIKPQVMVPRIKKFLKFSAKMPWQDSHKLLFSKRITWINARAQSAGL